MRWRKNEFPEDYVPTIFENSVCSGVSDLELDLPLAGERCNC